MDNNDVSMDLGIDNFQEDEVELNMFSADDSAKPVPYVTNNRVPPIPRKCIRKGDMVCYVKNENINMINNNTQRSATPTYSVNSDSKTRSTSETDNILSGESLYKTFIFEESLNDNDTQKCIAFWKSVMEKNLTPIKCTIIENKKKRARELKVEQEKKSSIIENRDDIIKEATDKVHAEYKAMWMAALKEIKRKKLDKVKLVGQARCKLCETIENPMEEYSTDIDSATVKEEVKGLNQWESVSKRPKRGEIRGGEELARKLKQKEREQTQYRFVNVIEEKKKSGTYKLWRSNMVKPPCSCGKKNCECNINPAIICMRTPLPSMMGKPSKHVAEPKTSKKEITPKSSTRSKEATPKSSVPEKGFYQEQLSQPSDTTPKPSVEEKRSYKEPVSQPFVEKIVPAEISPSTEEKRSFKEASTTPKGVTPKTSVDERKSTPQTLLAQKPKDEILSKPSEPIQEHFPEASSQTPTDQVSQADKGLVAKVLPFQPVADSASDPNIISIGEVSDTDDVRDIAEDVSGVLVTRATPFIMELADSIYREISNISTLPYADVSTFLKMPSEEFLAEVSQLVLARTRDLMENISENLIQEISQIIINKAKPMFETMSGRRETVEDVEVEEKDTVYIEPVDQPLDQPLHQPVVYPDQMALTSSMKKVTSEISPEPSMERQVSILLPTGEVQITKDHSVNVDMDTTWDKPTVIPSKIPAAARRGSLEMIKARKQMKKKSDQTLEKTPSINPVVSATVDSEAQTEFNLSVLHQGKDKPIVDQSKSSEKNHLIETKDLLEHMSNPRTPQDSLFTNKEQVSKHMSDMGEQESPEVQTDSGENKTNDKSEFDDEHIPHRLPRDSLFVTKERVARHKKEMDEIYGEEVLDPDEIQRQIRLICEITSFSSSKNINSQKLRDSIFVNKERVSKHKSDMAEESREIDEEQENQPTGINSPPVEIEMREIDSRSLRDSIFVNKERVSKHKEEWSEESIDTVEDVKMEKRQIRISEPIMIKKKKSRSLKDSIAHKKNVSYDESRKTEFKTRHVHLKSSPVEIKTTKQIKIDGSSIKDSLLVRKEMVGKTNPRMLEHKIVRDSLYVNKEHVSKHKKGMDEESLDDVDDVKHENRQIRILSKTTKSPINKKRTNPMLIKDSIYVTKERVAKHKKEMGETNVNDTEDPEVENKNRLIHILSEPKEEDIHIKRTNPTLTKSSIPIQKEHIAKSKKEESINDKEDEKLDNREIHISELREEDIHIKRTNPMRIKDSVFVTKERVAKHKKDAGEENEQVELKNRQIRLLSTPTEVEMKKKNSRSKNSSSIQKQHTDKRRTDLDPDIEGKNRQGHVGNPNKNMGGKSHDEVYDNQIVPVSSPITQSEIDVTALRDEIVDSVTVGVEESEKIVPRMLLHDTPNKSKFDNKDDNKIYPLDVPASSNEINLNTLLNANCIADSIMVRKEKLEKTHQRMLRRKPTKTKDYYPANKKKFTKKEKKNEGLVSQVIFETDYEKIKEKDPIENKESIRKDACDPCYCIKCPVLKFTRSSGKGRKKVYSCPLHAGNKKEKKKKCRSTEIPIIQDFSSSISKPESTDGPSSLKKILSGVSTKESKYTEF